jgi:hypothetical protein
MPVRGLYPRQLRELIVRPVLIDLGWWSQPAEDLVMGTAAQESRLRYLRQLPNGPALGIWQMEPATHDRHWHMYITPRQSLRARIMDTCRLAEPVAGIPSATTLLFNLRYGAAMCRLHYRRVPAPLPEDLAGQAAYWKDYYNTADGAGTVAEYVANYALVA